MSETQRQRQREPEDKPHERKSHRQESGRSPRRRQKGNKPRSEASAEERENDREIHAAENETRQSLEAVTNSLNLLRGLAHTPSASCLPPCQKLCVWLMWVATKPCWAFTLCSETPASWLFGFIVQEHTDGSTRHCEECMSLVDDHL